MAARTGVELYNLDAGPHTEIRLERPRYPGTVPFPQVLLDVDVFISVPCLKTHIHTDHTVTLRTALVARHNGSAPRCTASTCLRSSWLT